MANDDLKPPPKPIAPETPMLGSSGIDRPDVEAMRYGLASAGPLTQAVLTNNAAALAAALPIGLIDSPRRCTSTTRPSDPTQGQFIFELDTQKLLFWSGTAWKPISSTPVGVINDYAGTAAPSGWLLANGDTIPNGTGTVQGVTADFSALFAVIGSTYGAAGQLPDLRSRVAAGRGTMGATAGASNRLNGVLGSPDQLGGTGGDQYLQSHDHNINNANTVTVAHELHSHEYAIRLLEFFNDAQLGGSGQGGIGAYNYISPNWVTWQHPVTTVFAGQQNFTGTSAGTTWVSQTTGRTSTAAYASPGNATITLDINANGSGSAQNVQPTILLNKIIRYES